MQTFEKKPLEYVTQKWQNQVKQNERQFNVAVEQLNQYEIMLFKSLSDIEKVEAQTSQIKNTYKENLEELSSITTHQAVILDEL